MNSGVFLLCFDEKCCVFKPEFEGDHGHNLYLFLSKKHVIERLKWEDTRIR